MENKELKKIKKKLNLLIPESNGNINYIFENGKTILMRAIIMKAKNINPHKEILINYYIEKNINKFFKYNNIIEIENMHQHQLYPLLNIYINNS